MKLKDEVGMGGPKSTQTRFVGIIMYTLHPYTCNCFSRLYKLMACRSGGIDRTLTAWLVHSCT